MGRRVDLMGRGGSGSSRYGKQGGPDGQGGGGGQERGGGSVRKAGMQSDGGDATKFSACTFHM